MEEPLPGGNAGGAVLVDGTVRRTTGPWTPSVHALLRHLEKRKFDGAPRVLGIDDQGREVLSFLPGATVGAVQPWPPWVHSTSALIQVGRWLRRYHDAVRDFVPAGDAVWRSSTRAWRPGDVIGHNDAAPYNAVWQVQPDGGGGLVGFVDWDFAAPCPVIWDLASVAFSWVPLHARDVVSAEGFTDFAGRPRRLRLLLDTYGWTGPIPELLDTVTDRINAHLHSLAELAQTDPPFARLIENGTADMLTRALTELAADRRELAEGR